MHTGTIDGVAHRVIVIDGSPPCTRGRCGMTFTPSRSGTVHPRAHGDDVRGNLVKRVELRFTPVHTGTILENYPENSFFTTHNPSMSSKTTGAAPCVITVKPCSVLAA